MRCSKEATPRKHPMTGKKPPRPAPKPKTHKGPPATKADHAAFKRADKTIIKPMRIRH